MALEILPCNVAQLARLVCWLISTSKWPPDQCVSLYFISVYKQTCARLSLKSGVNLLSLEMPDLEVIVAAVLFFYFFKKVVQQVSCARSRFHCGML